MPQSRGVADAQRAVDATKADVAAKQQGVTDAQTELDAAKSDLDAANAAVDTGQSRPSSRSRSPLMLPTQP